MLFFKIIHIYDLQYTFIRQRNTAKCSYYIQNLKIYMTNEVVTQSTPVLICMNEPLQDTRTAVS